MALSTDSEETEAGGAEERSIRAQDVRLHYRAEGRRDAPAVVFAHSLGTDLRMWDPQVPSFVKRFRVIRYDSRGHGGSEVSPGPYTIDMLGGDLLALLDTLGIEHAHLCGLSLGGMVAQWLAAHHPERVLRAVFADTATKIGAEATWTERIALVQAGGMGAVRDAVVARFLSAPFRARQPEVARLLGEMLEATPPDGYIATCEALRVAELRSIVGRIHAPSLVLTGMLDESTPPAHAHDLHARISGSELLLIEDAAHLSNVERPDLFNASVMEFLSRT